MESCEPNEQFRRHLPWYPISYAYFCWHRVRGVKLPPSAVVFRGARLLRYPGNIQLGAEVVVKSGAHLCPCRRDAHITIGARTTVGYYAFLYASTEISVGDDCMIAPFVYIVDSDHGIRAYTPMNRQPNISSAIRIGNDVWIGAHSLVLAGVTIGDGVVVAAGTVVNTDVADGMIVGGVPARVLGRRK